PSLLGDRLYDVDAPRLEVSNRRLEVVAHQIQLMTVRSIAGVQRPLAWRQREDRPASAGIDRVPTENVAKELSRRLHLFRVDEGVDAGNHARAMLLARRFTYMGVAAAERAASTHPAE